MWLISGGAYQGKLEYILRRTGMSEKDVAEGEVCSIDELFKQPIVNHFHLWINRMLKENRDPYSLTDQIIDNNPSIIIVVNELGCGVVPMEPYDRRYREITGRICCMLAQEAKEVHRVMSGIGLVIKHD